ncbi:MAG: hypothetical protein SXQ77_13545 [Halobacteria archaeon]|nr:hypothetical protein [Halobacteria archaeon]
MSRIALDIETISPGYSPHGSDFQNSDFFELLAVGLGYDSGDGDEDEDESIVLFREDTSPESELRLVERVCDWIEERATGTDTLITYNGNDFDLIHLKGRASRTADEIQDSRGSETVERIRRLDEMEHCDLMKDVEQSYGARRSFEYVCRDHGIDIESVEWEDYDHGLDFDSWRRMEDIGKKVVINSDIARVGETYLALAEEGGGERYAEIRKLLEDYTLSDVRPLFELADNGL